MYSVYVWYLCNFASTSSKQAKSSQERVSHVVFHFLFPPVYLSPASRLRWNSTIKLAAGIKVKNGPHSLSVETLNFFIFESMKKISKLFYLFIFKPQPSVYGILVPQP